jgi:hypothetical protein
MGVPRRRICDKNGLLHWQTTTGTQVPARAERVLLDARAAFVSPGFVEMPARDFEFSKGLLVRDPDGHAVRIVSSTPPR